jgi:hypothetical protein
MQQPSSPDTAVEPKKSSTMRTKAELNSMRDRDVEALGLATEKFGPLKVQHAQPGKYSR